MKAAIISRAVAIHARKHRFFEISRFPLDICLYGNIIVDMPRASTTSDVFNAIAEPKRRQIIELLSQHRHLAVGAIVLSLGLTQPAVSKHLGVLRQVGLVTVVKQGQSRVYELNHEQLKPIYDWVKAFERHWDHQLDRIRSRAEQRAAAQKLQSESSIDHKELS